MRLPSPSPQARPLIVSVAGLLFLLGWDSTGLDLTLARWFGGAGGFAWRDNWWLTTVVHEGGRAAAFALAAWLVLKLLLRPRDPDRARNAWLLATAIGGMLLVSVIKRQSQSSCPWDLQPFGGHVAHVSHWLWGLSDGGPGHCFPAGHASAGFAWLAGWFAWRDRHPRRARAWLVGALAVGLLLGLAQQARGAHFASHTLWTAWLCWTWAWACTLLLPREDFHATAAG